MNRVALALLGLVALTGTALAGASITLHVDLPTGESHDVEVWADETTPGAGADLDGAPVQDGLGAPTAPELPADPTSLLPTAPDLPEDPTSLVPEAPALPADPEDLPHVPGLPADPTDFLPGIPSVPADPEVPSVPSAPGLPATPELPADPTSLVPGVPSAPAVPELPSDVPAVPPTPEVPTTPTAPDTSSVYALVYGALDTIEDTSPL